MQINVINQGELDKAINSLRDSLTELRKKLNAVCDYLNIEIIEEEYLDNGRTMYFLDGTPFLKEPSKISKRFVVSKKKKK